MSKQSLESGGEESNEPRRGVLKKALLWGLGLTALQAVPKAAQAGAGTGSPAGRTTGDPPVDGGPYWLSGKTGVDPAENPSWEGWNNPRLKAKDGWDDWGTVLNPNNLPIYHDRFDRIPKSHPKHHWGMVIDVRKCVGCQACVVGCKSENNVALGTYRTWVDVYQTGDTVADPNGDIVLDDGQRYRQEVRVMAVPKICNHCDDPPCVEVCPVKATFKRQDGIVLVDHRLCIGCGTCVNACPYDARYLDPVSHTADKCTFCVERVDAGLLPACVTTCVGRARVFGDLNDPDSEPSKLLAHFPHVVRHPEYGTKPHVFYIGMSGEITTDPDPNVQHMVYTYTSNANNSRVADVDDEI